MTKFGADLRLLNSFPDNKKLALDLEQEIGDLLRSKCVLMDGYTCRKVAECAKVIALSAKFKKESPCEAQDS